MNRPWEMVAEIFDAAVRVEPAQRDALLDERCGDDVELRREIEALLDQDDAAGDYLNPPHVSDRSRTTPLFVPESLGEFRIARRIGTGGMGSVFEAEQSHPQRRVALKMLPPFSDASSARRFSLEAQLLARMNHPSIAQVFAAGVDGDTPYLAMELVEGALPITDYARLNGLTLSAALDLFRGVCAGIAHGHAKGVVHRDLKPSNVLIDWHGSPKVIDFGIGRALDASDAESARMTRTGDLVGTLQYMSPEQAEGRIEQVDAQSDVHGLGLLLFEMLCGRRAFDLEGLPLTAALRKLAEHALPSARNVAPHLPVEIDWILRKTLEKDRSRRYASVAELDADLERFLSHQPVSAGPPSRVYEARKFVRRHRVGVLALTAVFVALAIGLAIAVRERSRTESARLELSGRTRELEIETARKDRVLKFQQRLLTAASPDNEGYDVRVVDLLDIARSDLAQGNEEPLVALELHSALGDAYSNLGQFEITLIEYSAAFELARTQPSVDPQKFAQLERNVVQTRATLDPGPHVIAQARALLSSNFVRFGQASRETILVGTLLAQMLSASAALTEAEELLRNALAHCDVEKEDDTLATVRQRLAEVLIERGAFAEAESLLRASLDVRLAAHAEEDPETMGLQQQLLHLLALKGDAVAAEQVARSCAEVYTRRFGPDHDRTCVAKIAHSQALVMSGRAPEAMPILDDVLARYERASSSAGRRSSILLRVSLAEMLNTLRRSEEATAILRAVEAKYAPQGWIESPEIHRATSSLAQALLDSEQYAEAERPARAAATEGEALFGRDSRVVVIAFTRLAQVLMLTSRASEAEPIFMTNLNVLRRNGAGQNDDLVLLNSELRAQALLSDGKFEEAEAVLRETMPVLLQQYGLADPRTLHARETWADVLHAAGRLAGAEGEYCELAAVVRNGADTPGDLARILQRLGIVRRKQGRLLDSLDAFREGHQIVLRVFTAHDPAYLSAVLNVASAWRRVGQPERVPVLLEPIYDSCRADGMNARLIDGCRLLLQQSYEQLGRTEDLAALRARIAAESKTQ